MASSGTAEPVLTDSKEDKSIKVKVVNQAGHEVLFVIKNKTKMGKLMKNYYARMRIDTTVRFRFDDRNVHESDTPLTLGLVDGDVIEVYEQQLGGFYRILGVRQGMRRGKLGISNN